MITLLRYVFDASPQTFNSIGASLLGIFPLITMFLVTSIATLRERTSGTLERLLSLGARRADVGQTGEESWHVLADPEGNEFCLLRRRLDPI